MILLSMAVETSHREMMYQRDEIRYGDRFQAAYGNKSEEKFPVYGSGMTDLFPANVFKPESGLTLASSLPLSRKRSRDSSFTFNPSFCCPNAPIINPNAFEFLTGDIGSQMIYQQQSEIDQFIAHHNVKVRTEIEEIRKQNSMRILALYEGLRNKLKRKEDEVFKIAEINRSLEEKVKSMSFENQIWRELAQTNEATANTLRNNLNQVLEQIHLQQQQNGVDFAHDAESHCGSNFEEDGGGERRRCRSCGKEESCVMLLPCRHLCVCRLCVSAINSCPVCNCTKSAGVQVNMSWF